MACESNKSWATLTDCVFNHEHSIFNNCAHQILRRKDNISCDLSNNQNSWLVSLVYWPVWMVRMWWFWKNSIFNYLFNIYIACSRNGKKETKNLFATFFQWICSASTFAFLPVLILNKRPLFRLSSIWFIISVIISLCFDKFLLFLFHALMRILPYNVFPVSYLSIQILWSLLQFINLLLWIYLHILQFIWVASTLIVCTNALPDATSENGSPEPFAGKPSFLSKLLSSGI